MQRLVDMSHHVRRPFLSLRSPYSVFRSRPRDRRGVMLLVVLSMLTLFMLVGITFVLITGRNRRTTRIASDAVIERAPQRTNEIVDRAFNLFLTGPADGSTSPLLHHGLLEDMYGRNWIGGMVYQPPAPTPGPSEPVPSSGIYRFRFTHVAGINFPMASSYFNGCVLTFGDGPFAGLSCRVVNYAFHRASGALPDHGELEVAGLPPGLSPMSDIVGSRFIINGRPFSGTGFGYNYATTSTDVKGDLQTRPKELSGTPAAKGYELALLPNHVFLPVVPVPPSGPPRDEFGNDVFYNVDRHGTSPPDPNAGGANEDYDAPDFQNPHLAWMSPAPDDPATTTINESLNPRLTRVVPSFHRPELIQWWVHNWRTYQPAADPEYNPPTPPAHPDVWFNMPRDLLRKAMLRPSPTDHFQDLNGNGTWDHGWWNASVTPPRWEPGEPDFTGQEFFPTDTGIDTNGDGFADLTLPASYDVDNDGDGIMDSIWMDIGLPVTRGPDGRLVKQLVAFMCLDMDGRANVNAHGSQFHTTDAVTRGDVPDPEPVNTTYEDVQSFVGSATPDVPRGHGYGPADVNLARALLDGTTASGFTDVYNLILSRYGADGLPGRTHPAATATPAIPATAQQRMELEFSDDPLSALKQSDFPAAQWLRGFFQFRSEAGAITGYGSPPDTSGNGLVALDHYGSPYYLYMNSLRDRVNDPYELDLSAKGVRPAAGGRENPYSVYELERLLRQYDIDVESLPPRLWSMLGIDDRARRHLLTTDSWDLPSPAYSNVPELRGSAGLSGVQRPQHLNVNGHAPHLADLLRAKIRAHNPALNDNRTATPPTYALTDAVNAMLPLFSRDLLSGQRMNLNRPYGNGVDEGGNGVVDEPHIDPTLPPATAASSEPVNEAKLYPAPDGSTFTTNNLYLRNGEGLEEPRQIQARQLYLLMMLLKNDDFDMDVDGDGAPDTPEETADYIAQWAVNAVDFADRDSIMTGFEYDRDPFNANRYRVNGNLVQDTGESDWAVVWGTERPELIITETLATHDRRTENLMDGGGDWDSTTMSGDDYDQRLRPQGSLFLELYNPWGPNEGPSGEFARLEHNRYSVELNGLSAADGAGKQSPIWRLLIVKEGGRDKDPDDPTTAFAPGELDRSVYFVDMSLTNIQSSLGLPGTVSAFYTKLGMTAIPPNRYAVIGPGDKGASAPFITMFGLKDGTVPDANGFNSTRATTRRVELHPVKAPVAGDHAQEVAVLNNSGILGNWANPNYDYNNETTDPPKPDIQRAVAIVINEPQRLSVTEPLDTAADAYPTGNGPIVDGSATHVPAADTPFDKGRANLHSSDADLLLKTATTARFRVVHLQRLADPLRPYHATKNPYRTIDSSQVDLTCFNGVVKPADDDGVPTGPNGGTGTPINFASWRRGSNDAAGTYSDLLWPQEPVILTATDSSDKDPSHNFDRPLRHTLGFINSTASGYYTSTKPASVPDEYLGAPNTTTQPFPWLTWNNRPYISQYELMLVPTARSSKFLAGGGPGTGGGGGGPTVNPNDPDAGNAVPGQFGIAKGGAAAPKPFAVGATYRGPFPHLLNFFQTDDEYNAGDAAGDFYRLLDYVHVPSRFVGTETWLNPNVDWNAAGLPFGRPFNFISNFRDPGRINLNTIADPGVWAALLNLDPTTQTRTYPSATTAPTWERFVQSRRGTVAAGPLSSRNVDPLFTPTDGADMVPTWFGKPYRTAGGADLVPLEHDAMMHDEGSIEATLLRRLFPPGASPPPDIAFLENEANASSVKADNTDRNPFFRYRVINRLGNQVTTRSNVYGVWMTIGYFEVEPVLSIQPQPKLDPDPIGPPGAPIGIYPPQVVYPDGYRIVREAGIESGNVRRHRAFYMYDRTIPVGFTPGDAMNSHNGILLRRYME